VCGKVRYSVTGEAVTKVKQPTVVQNSINPHVFQGLCHCLDCRKITGSTYSTNALFKEDEFKWTSGTPKEFAKTADGGKGISSWFW